MNELNVPVYIVDDDESIRDSLTFMLKAFNFNVFSFEDGQVFIDKANLLKPGCVLLDSRMPNLRGQEVHQLLNQIQSPLSVIFLTGHGDVSMAVNALKFGAVDFFQKPVDGDKLALAINKAIKTSLKVFDTQNSKKVFDSLTERETDILHLIVSGKRNQQIAADLFISVRTVEVHRSSLMKKLNAETVAELVMAYAEILK